MALPTNSIPRFLLPQLTWKSSAIPRSLVLPQSRTQLPIPQLPKQPRPRQFSNRASAWHQWHHKSITPKTSLLLFRPLPRPSPAALDLRDAILASRTFTSTLSLSRDHHFDTLKFVQRLKDEGFSEDQATAMMRVLSDVIDESIQNLTRTMVLREGAISRQLCHL